MVLENKILDTVIQDHKKRTVLGHTPFGDIFFKENDGYGQELYSVCQIIPPTRPSHDPAQKGEFMFEIRLVALSKKEFRGFLGTGLGGLLKLSTSHQFRELYDDIVLRRGLRSTLKERLGRLGNSEVYGYCTDDDYNSTNPYAAKVDKNRYLEEVLAYAKKHPRAYYSDIYNLASSSEFGPFVLKQYIGYGFEIPQELFRCTNLKSLAIYKQSVKDLSPEKLVQFKNLKALSLDNVGGLSNELLNAVPQLPYIVDLSISITDGYPDRKVFHQIPLELYTLKSLRYFSFTGHAISDWSEIVQLKSLKTLDVSNCNFFDIPEEIGLLQQLEELNLEHNQVKVLPEALLKLKHLRILRLNGNPLQALPEWIGKLPHLEILDVTQTGLTSLPDSIATLSDLQELRLQKNPFTSLPGGLLKLPKKVVKVEMRNQALYDPKAKAKLETYPKGNFKFENDFNFKLMVVNRLMYIDQVLVPKFDIWGFVKSYKKRKIDIEKEGYDRIPEAEVYFRELEIPMELLIDIKELKPDGGDEIYRQIIPFWDGEDEQFDVKSIEDIQYLPNLKATNKMNFSKELVNELRTRKIKVANY